MARVETSLCEKKRSAPFSQNPFVGDKRDLLLFFFREAGYRQSHSIPRIIISKQDSIVSNNFPIIAEVLIYIFLFVAGIEINQVGRDSVIAKPQGGDGSRLRKRNDPALQSLMTDIGEELIINGRIAMSKLQAQISLWIGLICPEFQGA